MRMLSSIFITSFVIAIFLYIIIDYFKTFFVRLRLEIACRPVDRHKKNKLFHIAIAINLLCLSILDFCCACILHVFPSRSQNNFACAFLSIATEYVEAKVHWVITPNLDAHGRCFRILFFFSLYRWLQVKCYVLSTG